MSVLTNNSDELLDFFDGGTTLTFKKGEILIRPEDDPSGVFLIQSGFIKTYAFTKYGDENLLIIRRPGEIFPVIWAFTDEHREVYYEAMTDTTLQRVSKTDFIDYIHSHKDAAVSILEQAVEMYRVHSERVYNLQFRSVKERVIYRLITLSKRFGTVQKNGSIRIEAPIRHHDIATSIATTRESVSREVSKLEKAGYVASEGGHVLIKDATGLAELIA